MQGKRRVGRSAVYNLTVERTPEFFANGILVHNCLDAWRYGAMYRPYDPVAEAQAPVAPLGWTPGKALSAREIRRPVAGPPLGSMS